MNIKQDLKYMLSGALAGAVNGFFGAGGGMVLVPLLSRLCKTDERRAFATCLSIILPLSVLSASVYFARNDFELDAALPFLLGGFLGGLAGGRLFKKVPARVLRIMLALLIIYGGIRSMAAGF